MRKVVRGAKKGRNIAPTTGIATVNSTFNNTIVTVADLNGHTICAASGGMTQKGSRKATSHAAQEAAKLVGQKVVNMGMMEIKVILKGPGSGRDSAVRGLSAAGLKVLTIADRTPIAHGGVRRRKKKRV